MTLQLLRDIHVLFFYRTDVSFGHDHVSEFDMVSGTCRTFIIVKFYPDVIDIQSGIGPPLKPFKGRGSDFIVPGINIPISVWKTGTPVSDEHAVLPDFQ